MSDQITYSVDGVDSENGHVRVDEFLERIDHLLTALNGIDRLVGKSGSPKLYYRIVAAAHASPLSITLQPMSKSGASEVSRDYVKTCHSRFFKELRAMRRMEPISPDIEPELLEHFRDIGIGVGRDFKSAVISNGEERVELDKTFESNASKLVAEENFSFGTFEGTLDAVNIHGQARRFWIYPKIGPQKVRCDFMPGTAEQIKEALGQLVRVAGLKFFGAGSPYPTRIKVKEFEIVAHEGRVSLETLRGIAPGATGEMSAVEFVRKVRNEWE
jgi:hypothetical protein